MAVEFIIILTVIYFMVLGMIVPVVIDRCSDLGKDFSATTEDYGRVYFLWLIWPVSLVILFVVYIVRPVVAYIPHIGDDIVCIMKRGKY